MLFDADSPYVVFVKLLIEPLANLPEITDVLFSSVIFTRLSVASSGAEVSIKIGVLLPQDTNIALNRKVANAQQRLNVVFIVVII